MDEQEFSNVYWIPANYTDSGKLLGGMVETRNAAETVVLALAAGYPQIRWLPLPVTGKMVVLILTLLPLCLVSLMGIDGDSLFQYLRHMIRFLRRKRMLHYRRIGSYDDTKEPPKRGRKKQKVQRT